MAETPEDFMGPNDHSQIVKGKRTKRQRLSSPFGMTSSSSSGGASSGGGGGERDHYSLIPSPATSISETSTEEEEDMANCLILLAQGCGPRENEEDGGGKVDRLSTRKFSDMAATGKAAGGFYIYACKTCNRTFPSFQALGGHRASHKKPKLSMVEEKKTPVAPPLARTDKYEEEEEGQFNKISPTTLSIHVASSNNKSCNVVNKANKVHECSICGSEFSSGQALGGHMRRHRSTSTTNIHNQIAMNTDTIISTSCSQSQDTEKPRNILPLDLNLPAPEDDHHHRDSSKFQFTSKQQGLVFSAPALVDCHY